jgi:exosortase
MLKGPAVVVAAQVAAFWPVWRWYGSRVGDSAEDVWGLLALAAAVFFAWKGKGGGARGGRRLLLPAALVVVYAAAYPFAMPLVRAALALTALGCTLSLWRFGRPFQPGLLGLLYLSLPVIPSLQFYGGYPLRAAVAWGASLLLRLGGFAVVQEGACLNWAGRLVWVDAPCSGVRMLWVGLFLACALACLYGLRPAATLAVLASAGVAILAGNVLRAAALFYVEAGVVEAPGWVHEYVGVVAFAAVASFILTAVRRIRKVTRCDTNSSTSEPAY